MGALAIGFALGIIVTFAFLVIKRNVLWWLVVFSYCIWPD